MNNPQNLIKTPLAELIYQANELRRTAFGKSITFCAIISIRSGNCEMDCKFCAQSRHHQANPPVYPLLDKKTLTARIMSLAATPVANIGLVASGGALRGRDFYKLCEIVADLPDSIKPRLCVSIGRVSRQQMHDLLAAGISHYHHNLETDKNFYPSICSTQTWQSRKKTAETALELGMELCCGCLFGMGESWDARLGLARDLADMGVGNVPINFLVPCPGTPLAQQKILPPEEALRVIAVLRHILPRATLRVCGGRKQALAEKQWDMFRAGANAIITGDYLTTTGMQLDEDMRMLQNLHLELKR